MGDISQLVSKPKHTCILNESLCNLQVVVQGRQVQGRESIVLGLIDAVCWGEVGEDQTHGSDVTPQSSMVEGIEAVVVRDGNIGTPL